MPKSKAQPMGKKNMTKTLPKAAGPQHKPEWTFVRCPECNGKYIHEEHGDNCPDCCRMTPK